MHIDSIQLFRVQSRIVESVIVAMSSENLLGLGEANLAPAPVDCAEWSAGAFACLRDWLAPALVGRAIHSGEALQNTLGQFQGNARAKAALDIAWWNLAAARQGKPLHELLGGRKVATRTSTSLGVMDSTDELFAQIRSSLEAGFEIVTLQYRPGWELEMVRAVRQAFPSEAIAIDCDGLCALGQMEMFYRLEDFHLRFIEQPLSADDLVGHAMLQSSLRTPICLDQSITSPERVEQTIDLASCRQINIDIGRVGGITPALTIRNACEAAHVPYAFGGANLGALSALAAAAFLRPNRSAPVETRLFDCEVWLIADETAAFGSEPADEVSLSSSDLVGAGADMNINTLSGNAIEQATIR